MATHSGVLAWRIPGMAEPGGLLSMGSHRVGHDWSDLADLAEHLSYILWCSYVGCICIYDCYIFFLDWSFDHYVVTFLSLFTAFVLKSILSAMSIATPAFFWSLFAWKIFFQSFTFSLYVSLVLRWVSWRQYIYRGLVFVSIQPVFVFWLGHSTHLRLR